MLKIILFDGYCNLCDATVNFVSSHDANNLYTFISLQSEEGQSYLNKYDLPINDFDTVILIENDEVYTLSTAALMIIKNLSGVVKYLHLFILIPKVIRDFIYKLIAKNRYAIFGKSKICKIHTDKI